MGSKQKMNEILRNARLDGVVERTKFGTMQAQLEKEFEI